MFAYICCWDCSAVSAPSFANGALGERRRNDFRVTRQKAGACSVEPRTSKSRDATAYHAQTGSSQFNRIARHERPLRECLTLISP